MRLHLDPPPSPAAPWSPRSPQAADPASREALLQAAHQNAHRLGTAAPASLDPALPLLATGHQAYLWHPGILAKDLALQAAADRLKAQPLHLIVDQDVHDVFSVQHPQITDAQLYVQTTHLQRSRTREGNQDPTPANTPTGCQPPAELIPPPWPVLQEALTHAENGLVNTANRAEQAAVLLHHLKQPYAGNIPIVFTSDLATLPAFTQFVQRMTRDAHACVAAYNQAARAMPQAGITPLLQTREQVELPLWSVSWNQPRRRVYADDQGLTDDAGRDIDPASLRPRALALTALLRTALIDLFIHGTGGALYDQITETWLQNWRPKEAHGLQPWDPPPAATMAAAAAVTADLTLNIDVPAATPAELRRAVWHRHHLPHNIDRVLNSPDPHDQALAARKHAVLDRMSEDRDRQRRAQLFAQLHAINDELVSRHPRLIQQADETLDTARKGLANRHLLAKRDWPFFLYPPAQLHALSQAIHDAFS